MKERAVDLVSRVNGVSQLQPGTRQHKNLPPDFNCSNTFFYKLHKGCIISSKLLGTIFDAG